MFYTRILFGYTAVRYQEKPMSRMTMGLLAGALWAGAVSGQVCESCVVISQVYGGGGNNGALWTNDFVELFNRGAEPVSLAGWSVQYAAAGGAAWSRTLLAGTIGPGQYYLVREGRGSGGTRELPQSDAHGAIAMASGSGKVALVAGTHTLAGADPGAEQGVVDLVGFGAAHSFRGKAPAPAPGNLAAIVRGGYGCFDTSNNSMDFTVTADIFPRNSSSPAHLCPGLLAIRNSPLLPPARRAVEYATAFAASGGSGAGYSFRLQEGVLPPGLALSGELLHGTPLDERGAPYSFTLRVTDSLGNSSTKTFQLPVVGERAGAVTVASR
jgi:uncharacterized protein